MRCLFCPNDLIGNTLPTCSFCTTNYIMDASKIIGYATKFTVDNKDYLAYWMILEDRFSIYDYDTDVMIIKLTSFPKHITPLNIVTKFKTLMVFS